VAQLQANVESLQLELSEEVLAEIEAVHQVYTYPGVDRSCYGAG
jgi:aryl-alcohol dehydrogenase-like predicted oxidoreductase